MAEFAFKDYKIRLLGRDVVGFQGLKYKKSVEKEYVYGRGNVPLGIQHGNQKVEGSLKILQSELDALLTAIRAANPLAELTDVTFDIVATYGDGLTAKTDIIQTVSITEYEKGLDQNDKFMVIDMPFMALGVLENV